MVQADGYASRGTVFNRTVVVRTPHYRIDRYGRLWFGPTSPDSTMHYAYWDGFDAEQKPIWILSRTEEPTGSLPLSQKEAEELIERFGPLPYGNQL